VLKVDFAQVVLSAGRYQIEQVGNLPYNISTPILFHLLACGCDYEHFMLQKRRSTAWWCAATADYGRLSVMLQWRYAMENVLFVPPESFDPPRAWTAPWCAWCRTHCLRHWTWRAGGAGAGGLQPAPQAAAPHPGPLAGAWFSALRRAAPRRGSAGASTRRSPLRV
jgi:hypothetical protein